MHDMKLCQCEQFDEVLGHSYMQMKLVRYV